MPDSEFRWDTWKVPLTIVGVASVLLWGLTVLLPKDCSERLSRGGDALAAVASLVTIGAVFFAIKQLELQQRSMKDQADVIAKEHRLRSLEVQKELCTPVFLQATDVRLQVIDMLYGLRDGKEAAGEGYFAKHVGELSKALTELDRLEWAASFRETDAARVAIVEGLRDQLGKVANAAVEASFEVVKGRTKSPSYGYEEASKELMDVINARSRALVSSFEAEAEAIMSGSVRVPAKDMKVPDLVSTATPFAQVESDPGDLAGSEKGAE